MHLVEERKNRGIWSYLFIIVLYSLISAFYLRSLLSGNNLMKWDIWDAEYPLEVLMTDAIRGGTLPLWNPLMRMGTPHYAMVGTPVWYPATLISELIGTTPASVAYIYGIHMVIGAFGMFLLAKHFLKGDPESASKNLAAFVGGLLYCFSGVFLSNAQHIMIIISAAWIPYVLYFVKRFLAERKLPLAMASGACAGMLILGGYPELFYDLFLVLVIYVLYFNWLREKKAYQNILSAAGKYLLICLFTVLACAIALIPFLNIMPHLTRTANTEQQVFSIPWVSLLSFLIPGVPRLFDGEPSMYNFYTGILVLVTLPCVVRKSNQHKLLFGGLAAASFLMCLGKDSPLYMLLHKFAPMYGTFRFPTVNRIFMSLFLILLLVQVWKELMETAKTWKPVVWSAFLALLGAFGWLLAKLVLRGYFEFPYWTQEQVAVFAVGTKIFCIAAGGYCMAFLLLKLVGKKRRKLAKYGIVAAAALEVLLFSDIEFPITVAQYDHGTVSSEAEARQIVDKAFEQNRTRTRNVDFSGQQRTSSGLYSILIANQKTFDDEGYLSIRLANVDRYLQTMNHSIIESNPVMYLTNNVVSEEEIPYETWIWDPAVPSEQIHMEEKSIETGQDYLLEPEELSPMEGEAVAEGTSLSVAGDFRVLTNQARCVKAYLKAAGKTEIEIKASFLGADGTEASYTGSFPVRTDGKGDFVRLYFPDTKKKYQSVSLFMTDGEFLDGSVCYMERMTNTDPVNQKEFGFNQIVAETNVAADGYLVILQADYPGWHAYVDGQEVEIETVNQCFMGIPLEKGNHKVELKFVPVDFYVGLAVTGLFWIALLWCCVWERRVTR